MAVCQARAAAWAAGKPRKGRARHAISRRRTHCRRVALRSWSNSINWKTISSSPPQQRAAWNAYADKVLRLADDMTRSRFAARTSTRLTEATAVQQLDQLAGSARNRLTAVEEIVEAGKALYATLTSEQKAIADRKLALPMLSLATGASPPGMSRTSTIN
jgi:LTXXQ motif family protein